MKFTAFFAATSVVLLAAATNVKAVDVPPGYEMHDGKLFRTVGFTPKMNRIMSQEATLCLRMMIDPNDCNSDGTKSPTPGSLQASTIQ